jgi:beta-lactamase regulating signal transducer with metallopeptidase domain
VTAAWMLATTIVALLLAGAALALVRVTALYRGAALRWIWALGTFASLAFALLWLRPSAGIAPVRQGFTPSAKVSVERVEPPPPRAAVPALAPAGFTLLDLPRVPRPLEQALLRLWLVISVVFIALLLLAAIRLYAERRHWNWREVADTRVLVSKTFGPAIVGVHHPAIVLPEWVLALDEASQRVIVAHEAEHRAAHDPALLLAGLAAIVLMPWNIGLWMSWRGLRRAIELDCDARVIARGIDASEYAQLLLGAWRSAHASWLPSTAFAERASGLGSRVEHLMRPEPRRRTMRTILGTLVAAGLVFIACVTPSPQRPMSDANAPYPLVIIDGVKRPDLPPHYRFTGKIVVETTTTPTFRVLYRGTTVEDSVARKLYPSMDDGTMMQTIDAPASVVHFGEQARYGAVLYYTKKYRDAGGAIIAPREGNMMVRASSPDTPVSAMVRVIYDRLFNGISLPADRAAQARAIIESEQTRQRALHGPILVTWPLRVEANAKRDNDLRALLTSDADRARFDVRSLESRPRQVTIEDVAQNQYINLFRNPDTKPDTKARALAVITTALIDEVALFRRSPDAFDERLAIRARRDTTLRALLPTEAEKALFDKIAPRTRDGEVKRP